MSKIKIILEGVSAELVVGTYSISDTTIFNDWTEFYNYNDIFHSSLLLSSYIKTIKVICDEMLVFQGPIPYNLIHTQQTIFFSLRQGEDYLRTECIEEANFKCEFETESFNMQLLKFEIQDFGSIFKADKSFLSNISYQGVPQLTHWESAKPIGNICLLCRFNSGYMVPIYDAITKTLNQNTIH
jgi:hypothetical protein